MTSPTHIEARVTHVYSCSAERVFNAWLDPALIGQWMFGPAIRDEEVVSIDVDARPGGAFSFLVKRQTLVVDHIGTYITIDKPTRLEFNWGVKGMSDNSRVNVTIQALTTKALTTKALTTQALTTKAQPAGCTLTLVHELNPAWVEYLQRSIDGWKQMLVALERALDG